MSYNLFVSTANIKPWVHLLSAKRQNLTNHGEKKNNKKRSTRKIANTKFLSLFLNLGNKTSRRQTEIW